jgi:hypothetical protein
VLGRLRPERERTLLVRFCGNENDPIIITALNLFNGKIVEGRD